MFVIVDGIDGSGKSTVTSAIAQKAAREGSVFDLGSWCKERRDLPRFEDARGHAVIQSFEPTRAWTGASIREEMLRLDASYSAQELADAYALDRLVLYRRLILPALDAGVPVVSDRGFTTSLVFQTAAQDGIPVDEVLARPGNAQAFARPPDHVVLCILDPKTAMERIVGRDGKPTHRFEDMDMMTRFHERFRGDWLETVFAGKPTRFHRLDMGGTLEESRAAAETLADSLLTGHKPYANA